MPRNHPVQPLALGVGLESGTAVVGSFGPARRRAHVALGEPVSVASRLQQMTQDLSMPVLIGQQLAQALPADVERMPWATTCSKGWVKQYTLFAPADWVDLDSVRTDCGQAPPRAVPHHSTMRPEDLARSRRVAACRQLKVACLCFWSPAHRPLVTGSAYVHRGLSREPRRIASCRAGQHVPGGGWRSPIRLIRQPNLHPPVGDGRPELSDASKSLGCAPGLATAVVSPQLYAERQSALARLESARDACNDQASRFWPCWGDCGSNTAMPRRALLWLERSLDARPEAALRRRQTTPWRWPRWVTSRPVTNSSARWRDRTDVPALVWARLMQHGAPGRDASPRPHPGGCGSGRISRSSMDYESNLDHSPKPRPN
jgi:hypothetical protein